MYVFSCIKILDTRFRVLKVKLYSEAVHDLNALSSFSHKFSAGWSSAEVAYTPGAPASGVDVEGGRDIGVHKVRPQWRRTRSRDTRQSVGRSSSSCARVQSCPRCSSGRLVRTAAASAPAPSSPPALASCRRRVTRFRSYRFCPLRQRAQTMSCSQHQSCPAGSSQKVNDNHNQKSESGKRIPKRGSRPVLWLPSPDSRARSVCLLWEVQRSAVPPTSAVQYNAKYCTHVMTISVKVNGLDEWTVW